jgi:hypothetical protein
MQRSQPETRSEGLSQRLDLRKVIAGAILGNEIFEVIQQIHRRDKTSRSVRRAFL